MVARRVVPPDLLGQLVGVRAKVQQVALPLGDERRRDLLGRDRGIPCGPSRQPGGQATVDEAPERSGQLGA
ncbi:hypothetical protein ACNAW0_13780 [Micromonospora sp. SL1-18]|uniref:hypothetical protein n=1 Tax=Micromonospora sp. SL1-18 TaxID=3399128 RepID=UPI003A4DFEB2